eukprot:Selendium_serpulae@DN4999_c0_g1_i1.p1
MAASPGGTQPTSTNSISSPHTTSNSTSPKKRYGFFAPRRSFNTSSSMPNNSMANDGSTVTASSRRRRPMFRGCVTCFRNPSSSPSSGETYLVTQKSGDGDEVQVPSDGQHCPNSAVSQLIAQVPKNPDSTGTRRGRKNRDNPESSRRSDNGCPRLTSRSDQARRHDGSFGVLSPAVHDGVSHEENEETFHIGQLQGPFLGPQDSGDIGKKTLVLDLDETLVHSCFRPVNFAAFIIPVEIDGFVHNIYVCKRPGVDEFLSAVAERYEVVIFTASLKKYADPLIDKLDPKRKGRWRLFREACTVKNQNYIKDLSKLGRPLKSTIIIDNSPHSYCLQPDNAIPIGSWFDNMNDTELYDLIPILRALSEVDDIPAVMKETLEAGGDDSFC